MRDRSGRLMNMVLKPGSRITKPENPLITDGVRLALLTLADLTEYHRIGVDSIECNLSDLIDSGAAYSCMHEARLRILVTPRIALLEAWLASGDRHLHRAPLERPSTHTEDEWARELKDWSRLRGERAKQAQACVMLLKGVGF